MGLLENLGLRPKSLAVRLIQEAKRGQVWDLKLKELATGREFLELPKEEQAQIAVEIAQSAAKGIKNRADIDEIEDYKTRSVIGTVLSEILRRKLPFFTPDFLVLLGILGRHGGYRNADSGIVKAIENFAADNPIPESMKAKAVEFCEAVRETGDADHQRLADRVANVFGIQRSLLLKSGDVWADQAIADIGGLPQEKQRAWAALIEFCRGAKAGKPTKKWMKELAVIFPGEITEEEFAAHAGSWFRLIDKPAAERREMNWYGSVIEMNPLALEEVNQDILKGMCWVASTLSDRELIRSISAMGISAFKKIPGVGPRATRLGNACVYALGAIEANEALAQLALMKVKIKNRGTQNQIAKALDAAAERLGVSPEEVEEISVPTYGMTDVGVIEKKLGEFTARLEVTSSSSTTLQWVKPDGTLQKSIPAAVKADFSEELKELRADAKDLQKMLPAVRERIDGSYLRQQSWSFGVWKERYLDHPLTGWLSRKLIWTFTSDDGESANGMFREPQFLTWEGKELELTGDETVSLWHPLDSPIEEVLHWRNWLEENEIQQPFKQAHREIYLLTDAERNTETYSNRFAAHIVKQHQFNALCLARSWKNTLRLAVDDSYPPASRYLDSWGIRAEYWIEGIGEYGEETTDTGTYLYLATDQVRFYPIDSTQVSAHASGGGYSSGWRGGADTPMKLDEVPRLVFSEIMRDCDLFVGVASVGNDPNWADGGPEVHRNYWQSFSFGELSNTARTRKEILERLLPKLKIAKQCKLDGRYLIVEGTVRTYKIHLGSGNILMEPSDEYLCIVPNASQQRQGTGKVFLPFEGDKTLAIILSKAFLLAADDKIKDRTILSQIRR